MKMHKFNIRQYDLELSQIQSIELVGQMLTVDIRVQKLKIFFANGILTHNSAASSDIVTSEQVAHSYGKIEIADFVLSMSVKLEDLQSNTARFFISKNRGGKRGARFNAQVDLDLGYIDISAENSKKTLELQNIMDNKSQTIRRLARQRMAVLKMKNEEKGKNDEKK